MFSSLEWKKLRVIFIYHIISLFHLQMHQICHGDKTFSTRGLWLKVLCSTQHASFSQTTLQQLFQGKSEGCVVSCAAQVPEEVTRLGVKTVTLVCKQSLHQLLVGFSLPFQVVMLLHILFTVPHQPLSQLTIWHQPLRLTHKFLMRIKAKYVSHSLPNAI